MADAAERLEITKEAVRKRIAHGTLRADKDPDGTVRVYVPPSPTASDATVRDELVAQLQDEVAHLRRESERKDEIIMTLSLANAEQARTIRAIEAPFSQEPSESPQAPTSPGPRERPFTHEEGATVEAAREPAATLQGTPKGTPRSWWRRLFGS